jgi:hypothetical protein
VQRLAVAVACLAGAGSETEAAGLLACVPDLSESAERRGGLPAETAATAYRLHLFDPS